MEKIETYGLVGYPLGHSFSREYFTEKFRREGRRAQYLNFEIADIGSLPQVLKGYSDLKGFNVTIPHKQNVISLLDEIEDEAKQIGAVNVVRVLENGRLKGYNSDYYGFVESIGPMLCDGNHKKALVLGVGGASRAVCYGLAHLGIEVTRVSRRSDAGDMTYDTLTPDIVAEHTVVVNTTPLGMFPNTDSAPDIPYCAVTTRHVCYDLVYNPLETKFMKLCSAAGAKVSNGLAMLHLQAERAWQIWNE